MHGQKRYGETKLLIGDTSFINDAALVAKDSIFQAFTLVLHSKVEALAPTVLVEILHTRNRTIVGDEM